MSEARHQRFEIDIDEIERQLRSSADLAPPAKADPLAELARIVGQNDPFRGILGERKSGEPAPVARQGNVHVLSRAPEPEAARYEAAAAEPPAEAFFDPVSDAYGSPEAAYAEDDLQPLTPRRSRGRILAVLAALLLTSAAVGGGLYWRKTGGRLDLSGPPPVITADKTPLKVAPTDPGGVEVPNQNKQIYDRKMPDGQSRVVDAREQPVDVREVARTLPPVTPAVPVPDAPPARPSVAPGTASLPSSTSNPVSSVLGEPKRVRTVAVRPDGSVYAPPGQPTLSDAAPSLMPGTPPAPVPVATVSVPVRPGQPAASAILSTPAPAVPDAPLPAGESDPALAGEPAVKVLPPRRPRFEVAAATPAETPRPRPAAAAPEPAEKPAVAKNDFVVQVAVRDNEGEARTAWNGLLEKYPGDLEGRRAQVNKAEVKGKTVYRVRVGPLSKAEATALCGKLKSSGGGCFVAAK